uniref:Uncharacterized protein n=1 Tax=Anopheles dirus TaxID=7168 RepID=A0A182N5R8_9DIPT
MNNFSDIFNHIKPLFDAIIKSPTKERIITLNEHLQNVDEHSVQILQNRFLQQLVSLVDSVPGQNKNELKTHLLECIITVLQKGHLANAMAVKTTLIVCVTLVYDRDTVAIRPNLSEEYKLGVLKVLSLVTRRIQSELIEDLYVKDNLYEISQAIFVCVRIVDTERARKLRFQAIDTILSLLQVHDDFDFNDVVLRCQVAKLVFITLPKLLATFVVIINGDEKQGIAVCRIAIKALGRILSLIFADYSKEADTDNYSVERFRELTKCYEKCNKDGNANVLGVGLRNNEKIKYFNDVTRTRDWLLQAEKQVEKVLVIIAHLRGHDEELVRLDNMPSCTVHFLQTVIALCHDESERVRNICETYHKSVPNLSISFAGTRVDELFFDALTRLPRIIYRGEEREQIASFRLITGYLRFFSESQLVNVFSAQNILEQFVMVLLAGAELESVDELIRREYVSYRFEYEEGFRLQKDKNESRWIVLKNIQSPRAKQSFLDIIHKLRSNGQVMNIVLLYILADFYSSRINSNSYLFILSELIPDDIDCARFHMEPFKSLLGELLQSQHWFLELDENDNIVDQKYITLHICLVVRTIARIARLMQDHFRWYLYDALRILLQCCGSTLNCVNESTELALDTVARSQGMSSIGQLIHHNLDYISQQITRCLRRTDHFLDGMCILEAVLRFIPYESSNVLETTVTPIVMNILDSYSQYGERNSIVCLRVLQIFIHSIRLRYAEEVEAPKDTTDETASAKLSQEITRLQGLLQREIAIEPEDSEFQPDDDIADKQPDANEELTNGDEKETEENEENLPVHIKVVLRILSVNFKYLASSYDGERIVALSTLNEGIYVLRQYENQLLPLVHNIWFNFTERFTDRNPAVVSHAFDLLVTLALLAKDFIRKRSLDDVLPKLYKFMTDHWNADTSAHQVYKLQCKFMSSIDDLVKHLNFSEKQLDQALEVVRLYWERCERRELKRRAAECMQRMRTINALALLDASEKFHKSPSIENLVKQCMKGTEALNDLKHRVAQYKLAKQTVKVSMPETVIQEIPKLVRDTINCAEELQRLSEDIVQFSTSKDADFINRSSLAAQSISDTTARLQEIEMMWQNVPLPEEEGSSLGLIRDSMLRDAADFLQSVSTSLNDTFESVNEAIEDVLQTPNTASLNKLKMNLSECKILLSDITLNHSLLLKESIPSFEEPPEDDSTPLLNSVTDELDKSWKSEIEAFLEIWKSPEKERFLQISKQTIDDLSRLRLETNRMLERKQYSDRATSSAKRRQHLIERLDVLRDAGVAQKPVFSSILMKDFLDEDDFCAEQAVLQETFSQQESFKKVVKFADHAPERSKLVEKRIEDLLQQMDNFQQNILNFDHAQAAVGNGQERQNADLIEKKLDSLMFMISELVKTLRAS